MRRQSTRLAIVLVLGSGIAWLGLASNSSPLSKKTYTEFYFHHDHIIGTSLDLWLVAADIDTAQAAEHSILDEIERLRLIFSTYDESSEISRLNRTREPMAVSPEMIEVLTLYETMQARSNGAFNGHLVELVRVWLDAEKTQCEPDAAVLSEIVAKLRQPGWRIDKQAKTVTRLTDQSLNLNSIAKGYIIQHAAAAARSKVPMLQGLLLNLGGDMAVWGRDDLGQPQWTIGIQDPHHPEDNAAPIACVLLQDCAIATSGGYERFYTINGKRHSHIFDPRTGRSATGIASATVVAADNVMANALATTLCVLTPEEGLRLVAATPGAECLLVTEDGKHIRSAGFATLEIPIADKKGEKEAKADAWPDSYQVNFRLTIPTINAARYRNPYVAIWVENSEGKAVRTITVWGNNPRWINSLPEWWKIGSRDSALVKTVSRATRGPGKYNLAWDGKDDKGNLLGQGTYTFHVEVHREHGKLVRQSGKLECRADPSSITLGKNAETGDTIIEYAKKKAP